MLCIYDLRMALIRCPECNCEVSEKASVCPHCGFPFNETKNENKEATTSIVKKKQSPDLVALISLRGNETFAGPIIWLTIFTLFYAVLWVIGWRALPISLIYLGLLGVIYAIIAFASIRRIIWVNQFNSRGGKVIYYDRTNKAVCFDGFDGEKIAIPLDDILGFYGPTLLRIKFRSNRNNRPYVVSLGFTTREDVNKLNALKMRSL